MTDGRQQPTDVGCGRVMLPHGSPPTLTRTPAPLDATNQSPAIMMHAPGAASAGRASATRGSVASRSDPAPSRTLRTSASTATLNTPSSPTPYASGASGRLQFTHTTPALPHRSTGHALPFSHSRLTTPASCSTTPPPCSDGGSGSVMFVPAAVAACGGAVAAAAATAGVGSTVAYASGRLASTGAVG
jgi:hypothetical protein